VYFFFCTYLDSSPCLYLVLCLACVAAFRNLHHTICHTCLIEHKHCIPSMLDVTILWFLFLILLYTCAFWVVSLYNGPLLLPIV
jgi:hypothetical protein